MTTTSRHLYIFHEVCDYLKRFSLDSILMEAYMYDVQRVRIALKMTQTTSCGVKLGRSCRSAQTSTNYKYSKTLNNGHVRVLEVARRPSMANFRGGAYSKCT